MKSKLFYRMYKERINFLREHCIMYLFLVRYNCPNKILQKEMEETSNMGETIETEEKQSDEVILPMLIRVAKKIYDENWVSLFRTSFFFVVPFFIY